MDVTVGRSVYYYPDPEDKGICQSRDKDGKPVSLVALVCKVNGPNSVNLAVFDEEGVHHKKCDVPFELVATKDNPAPEHCFAGWMPFQKGQAAKTEELEKKLASTSPPAVKPAVPPVKPPIVPPVKPPVVPPVAAKPPVLPPGK